MSVGLSLVEENRVSVIFVEEAVYALLKSRPELIGAPEMARHLETLLMLGAALIAEEALKERDLKKLDYPVERMTRQEIAGLLGESKAVIVY